MKKKARLQIAQAELLSECRFMEQILARDIAELKAYSITNETIAQFHVLINDYQEILDDERYLAMVKKAYTEKAKAKKQLLSKMKYIMQRVASLYPSHTATYHFFGTRNYLQTKEVDLVPKSSIIHHAATIYSSELQARNIQQRDLDELKQCIKRFSDSVGVVNVRKSERKQAQANRLENGMELKKKREKFSTIGKLVWKNKRNALYKDYLLH